MNTVLLNDNKNDDNDKSLSASPLQFLASHFFIMHFVRHFLFLMYSWYAFHLGLLLHHFSPTHTVVNGANYQGSGFHLNTPPFLLHLDRPFSPPPLLRNSIDPY